MSFGFKKRIKIAPGLHINIGKKGVSARVGGRVAGVTVGTSGARASANIPGTGVSFRHKISGPEKSSVAEQDLIPQHPEAPARSRVWQYFVAVLTGIGIAIALAKIFKR